MLVPGTAPSSDFLVVGPTDNNADLKWQHVVTAVAAAAGGAAWVSAVGSGVVALRLRQADLPVEPVVALMSAEHRFAIGAGILTLPLLAGCLGFVVDWAANVRVQRAAREAGGNTESGLSHGQRRHRVFAVILLGLVGLYILVRPPVETFALAGVAVALAVPLALEVLHVVGVPRYTFQERLAVFLSVLVAAGIGAILAENFGSPSFDDAVITVRDQPVPITGAYITSTEHSVVLSTRCEVIEAVPRDQIERISVGPDELKRTHC